MDLNNHDAYCVGWYRKLIADGTAEDGQRISVLLHDDNEKLESEILALKAEVERLRAERK